MTPSPFRCGNHNWKLLNSCKITGVYCIRLTVHHPSIFTASCDITKMALRADADGSCLHFFGGLHHARATPSSCSTWNGATAPAAAQELFPDRIDNGSISVLWQTPDARSNAFLVELAFCCSLFQSNVNNRPRSLLR